MKLIALLLFIFSSITPILAQSRSEQLLSPPANDNFASALVLTGVAANAPLTSNAEATGEIGEPNHGGVAGPLNSMWYRWTAPVTVSITLQAGAESGYNPVMAVYTGSAVNALTLVTSNDNAGGFFLYSRVTFLAVAGTTYNIAVDGVGSATGISGLSLFINRAESSMQFDFDGDFKSDFAVFRSSTHTWYIRRSSDGSLQAQAWGAAGDLLAPGDYDGDTKTDICVFRPSTATFYALKSSDGLLLAVPWGQSGDVPVQGDFDGDDRADFAVYRGSTDTFYVRRSTDGSLLAQQWGEGSTDVVAPGDYDGDGKTDFAVYRFLGPEAGHFYVLRSSDNAFVAQLWGLGPDLVVPGDFDHDGRSDFIVHRSSDNTFYGISSGGGVTYTLTWGTSGDNLAPGDYEGDGYTDVASVWRPSTGTFYVQRSSGGTIAQPWGASGDTPVALSNVH
ncbi:MAG: VCBS repeat-containing protein [Acidobacteria bacterium]|nr:VCBS repeat-containing protein [Acidobacteriota bacterium]